MGRDPAQQPKSTGWGATPSHAGGLGGETPSKGDKKKSRWDETPTTFSGATPAGSAAMGMATPTVTHAGAMTPEQIQALRWERDIDERNRPLTDEELDALFPEGYKVSARRCLDVGGVIEEEANRSSLFLLLFFIIAVCLFQSV